MLSSKQHEPQLSASNIYRFVFHITHTLSIMRFTSPVVSTFTSIRFDYLGIVLLTFITLVVIVNNGPRQILQGFLQTLDSIKYLTWALILYVLWDIVGFLRAETPDYVIDKYLFWLKIAAVVFFMLLYSSFFDAEKDNSSRDIQLNLGITAVITALVAQWGYYSGQFMHREGIITPIQNQNTFAVMLVLGYLALIHYIFVYLRVGFYYKLAVAAVTSFILLSTIYLSGSRRSILSLAFILALMLLFVLVKSKKLFQDKIQGIAFLLALLLVCIGIYGHIVFFNQYQVPEPLPIRSTIPQPEDIVKQPANTKDYLDQVTEGSALASRFIIWQAALRWIGNMDLPTLIIGGGASYQVDVFDELDHPFNKEVVEYYERRFDDDINPKSWMWPHNFLLDDILSGGIVKALLTVLALIAIAIFIVRILPTSQGILMLAIYFVLFGSLFMSGKNGLLGEQMTWIIIGFTYLLAHDLMPKTLKLNNNPTQNSSVHVDDAKIS